MTKSPYFLAAIIFLTALLTNVSAHTCTGAASETCDCSDCSDCTSALTAAGTGATVRLTSGVSNQVGDCIDNPAGFSSKTFDCQGHTIDGDDSGTDYGIQLLSKDGNTLRNCTITQFYQSMQITGSSGYTISNNNLSDNLDDAVYWSTNTEMIFSNNIVKNNGDHGLWIWRLENISIHDNVITGNADIGVYIDTLGTNVSVLRNNLSNNGVGVSFEDCLNCRAISNHLNNNVREGLDIEDNSDNFIAINNTINNNGYYGIDLDASDYVTIFNNTINSNTRYGIYLHATCNYFNFTNNSVSSNQWDGIYVSQGYHGTIEYNNIGSNQRTGMYFYDFADTNNTLNYNTICYNNQSGGSYWDIVNSSTLNNGDENTCDTTSGWNDAGTTKCTYYCGEDLVPPSLSWNWTDINSTTGLNHTTVCVNASETVNCILHFNGTSYANSTSATNVCWTRTGLSDGNYSLINATCDDANNNSAPTTNAWLDVRTSLDTTLVKTANTSTAYPNQTINWTITVNNTGAWAVNATINDSNGQNFTVENITAGTSQTVSYLTNTTCSSVNNTANATLVGNHTNESAIASYTVTVTTCGDGVCNCGEACGSCAADCGSCPEDDDDDDGEDDGGGSTTYVLFTPPVISDSPPDTGPDRTPYIAQKTEEPVEGEELELAVWYTDGTPPEGDVTAVGPDGTRMQLKIDNAQITFTPHIPGKWTFTYIDIDGEQAVKTVNVMESMLQNQTVNQTVIKPPEDEPAGAGLEVWLGILLLILTLLGLFYIFWRKRKKREDIIKI